MSATDERPAETYRDFRIKIEGDAVSLMPVTEEASVALGAARLASTWQVRKGNAAQGAIERVKQRIDEIWAQADK